MNAPIIQAEEEASRFPNLELVQLIHRFDHLLKDGKSIDLELQTQILAMIEKDDMAPFYEQICSKYGWIVDDGLLASMRYRSDIVARSVNNVAGFTEKRTQLRLRHSPRNAQIL